MPRIFLEEYAPGVLPRGVSLRRVYEKGIELTASMEGFRGRLYSDPAGYCTIGFGHLVRRGPCDGNEPVQLRNGLTRAAALALLREDMSMAERAVLEHVDVPLSDGQFAALCDFTYNLGRGTLARSDLLDVVNDEAFHRVAGQLRRYVYAGGRRLEGLVTRREREIALFFEGMVVPRSVPAPDEDLSPIDILELDDTIR